MDRWIGGRWVHIVSVREGHTHVHTYFRYFPGGNFISTYVRGCTDVGEEGCSV